MKIGFKDFIATAMYEAQVLFTYFNMLKKYDIDLGKSRWEYLILTSSVVCPGHCTQSAICIRTFS